MFARKRLYSCSLISRDRLLWDLPGAPPPGNRLEHLKGGFTGFYSIRINDRFRVIFKMTESNSSAVQIVQVELAQKIGVPIQRVNTLINGKRACTAETALLLSRAFGTSPEFWMNLQNAYDLYNAKIHLRAA